MRKCYFSSKPAISGPYSDEYKPLEKALFIYTSRQAGIFTAKLLVKESEIDINVSQDDAKLVELKGQAQSGRITASHFKEY